jgi:uncharacterized protein YecT (DUF1311 family)
MRKLLLLFVPLALALSLAPRSHADDADDDDDNGSPPAAIDPCADAESQAAMDDCTADQYKKNDAALNDVYKQLVARQDDPDEKKDLVDSEKAWIKFRDADCTFMADDNKGGTIYPAVMNDCLSDLTQARTKELKAKLDL